MHLVNALADLSAYGVAFISLRDNIDLSTPSGRLMFQIIGAMAVRAGPNSGAGESRSAERASEGQASRSPPAGCGHVQHSQPAGRWGFVAGDLP
jgi:DNA invertase Pin-like site-specific DNA recombinase